MPFKVGHFVLVNEAQRSYDDSDDAFVDLSIETRLGSVFYHLSLIKTAVAHDAGKTKMITTILKRSVPSSKISSSSVVNRSPLFSVAKASAHYAESRIPALAAHSDTAKATTQDPVKGHGFLGHGHSRRHIPTMLPQILLKSRSRLFTSGSCTSNGNLRS